MCGITGYWTRRAPAGDEARRVLDAMTDALRHRGPDSRGTFLDLDNGLGLGHRRLSIIDVSPSGHQPMESASGRYVISFNGEVFNFGELRAELEAQGFQ